MIRYVLSPSFDARRIRFWFEVFIAGIHVPPYLMIRHYADVQLICFLRVYQVMKFVKHHNPLKFGRVMGSITQVSPIDFHESNFMFKVFIFKRRFSNFQSYFVKFPILTNAAIYCYCIFGLAYGIFVLERHYGEYKSYLECVWMISVTLPDLGFG